MNKKVLILIIFFLLGASSVISQSIIFREFLVVFYGNELLLGFILFAWLLSITMGAFSYRVLQKSIKDELKWFLNTSFSFSMLPFALIPVIRISRSLLGVEWGVYIPFFKMAYFSMLIMLPPAFIIGFTFPLGCKVLSEETSVSDIYMAESLGSLLGGGIFSFVLIRLFSAPFIASLLCLSFSVTFLVWLQKEKKRNLIKKILLIAIPICLLLISSKVNQYTVLKRWKSLTKDLPLLKNFDSPYQNISITQQLDQYSVFFNGMYGFSFPDPYNDSMVAHHILSQSPKIDSVLIIGEVTPTLLSEFLKEPVKKVTFVYFDPSLYKIITPYFSHEEKEVFKDKRVKQIFSDGRLFAKTTKEKFDVIYINIPDPSNALINRYYTLEFYKELSHILNPSGIVVVKISSSENYLGKDMLNYNGAIYKTLKSVFPYISICPETHSFLFASKSNVTTENPNILMSRFQQRKVKNTTFSPYVFSALYIPERVKYKREILEGWKGRLNTDLSPIAYLYNLRLWDQYSNSKLKGIIDFVEKKGFSFWAALFAIIPVIFIIIGIIRKDEILKPATLYSVFAIGLTGMGLSVTLIFAYQNIYGYLFEKIGFLIALFMMGLFIGGALSKKLIKRNIAKALFIPVVGTLIVLLCIILPWVIRFLETLKTSCAIPFYLLMIFSGILTGITFPLSSKVLENYGQDIGSSVSKVDAADHLGGSIGAILVGAFLIPILGIPKTLSLMATVVGYSVIIWLIYFLLKKKQKAL